MPEQDKIVFSPQEISIIEKNLGFIVFDWSKHLIHHILSQASQQGVKIVYMNTSKTLQSGNTSETKTDFFYEKLPPLIGFKHEKANLRGKGLETLWAYHLDVVRSASFYNFIKMAQLALEKIPRKYQGAFVNIIGKKEIYTQEDINRVLSILEKKTVEKKSVPKFYYDWSREWSGGQRFYSRVNETVVLQKMPNELQLMIENNPVLRRFWGFLLSSGHQHFGTDTIGFALVSKIKPDVWVINEIQTDCLGGYLRLRKQFMGKEQEKREGVSWDTLKDLLEANNRKKWISVLEADQSLKEHMMKEPSIISQLPDDSHDINEWIKDKKTEDLIRHFHNVNFNTRIFRIY